VPRIKEVFDIEIQKLSWNNLPSSETRNLSFNVRKDEKNILRVKTGGPLCFGI
jgi:hypothetical protein